MQSLVAEPITSPEAVEYAMENARLNLSARARTSRLPWRGQFSPELVEYLIDTICPDAATILDPFCGSGTVLFEAAARGAHGIGTEVNPAAWQLAAMACLTKIGSHELDRLQSEFQEAAGSLIVAMKRSLSPQHQEQFLTSIREAHDPALKKCLSTSLLLAMGDKADVKVVSVERAAATVLNLLGEMKSYRGSADCHLADARAIPAETGTIDAVITSPPYINVFNYHQNYRPAAELLGWEPLAAARSEFGSNRKHRQNRFLTVVQYCLDMAEALDEIARVCRPGAPVVVVVGRESNVLGTKFHNSELLISLFQHSPAFQFHQSNERVFMNRFGQEIYEDVLVATALDNQRIDPEFTRALGATTLKAALNKVPEKSKDSLQEASRLAHTVKPSPIYIPPSRHTLRTTSTHAS